MGEVPLHMYARSQVGISERDVSLQMCFVAQGLLEHTVHQSVGAYACEARTTLPVVRDLMFE